ncbi:uncharacterized protein EURHEDRAFT_408489 [Aspergillus ruber CBS 135680]|uniref:Uncharacterized protein n=1 Tax=Aspergillus ruber (strain CBS 135680) TaxID=1388766 RepID=A0A017SSG8_ASPRC|nr:uncharacterized protein EURHEDRAFT_408489 [Aspergillus ruber CBS 135680]EYE99220.1 hypothetical protein EURHEDRAFT_408489 [Aspergillus ruber CBS 135680]
MQVAEILSDITSLRVCDHADALTLVTVNERLPPRAPSQETQFQSQSQAQSHRDSNEDLRRAKELVNLHHELKTRHANGTVDEELARARENVKKVLKEVSYNGEGISERAWDISF